VATAFEQIQQEVRLLKLDDTLLTLNHLLAVSRGDKQDPSLAAWIPANGVGFPAFVVHFIVKQVLLNASNLGIRKLECYAMQRLYKAFFELEDPISRDANWKDKNPAGFFERFLSPQFQSQQRNWAQKQGLALALFRDSRPVQWPSKLAGYSLRKEIEDELGLDVDTFIAMGVVTMALGRATVNGQTCPGTFNHQFLADALRQGVKACTPLNCLTFLQRVSCGRDAFRAACSMKEYRVTNPLYAQFEFNPLRRFPITDVGDGRFIAVDPDMIADRCSLGLFYDLFERFGLDFAHRFAPVFDQLVGSLLRSVLPSVWSAAEWEMANAGRNVAKVGKRGDWIYVGENRNVLIECKSLRPSLELVTYGSDEALKDMVRRIAGAVKQLAHHDNAIQNGDWSTENIPLKPPVAVIVTYGQLITANFPFVRHEVRQQLSAEGTQNIPPFVVLSIQELDMVIRLVELGHRFDDVVFALCDESSHLLARFGDDLKTKACSSFAFEKHQAHMDSVLSGLHGAS
jgi:hypothetical protein